MFGILRRAFGKGGEADDLERWGDLAVPRETGRAILDGTPGRKAHVAAIRERLGHIQKDEKPELVDRLLLRFALYVFDLPASERHHHAGRWGLLDHSLEVAAKTLGRLSGPGFRASPDPLVDHRERPGWVYAGLVLALAHDLGKALDVELVLPEDEGRWDARKEPLAAFVRRHGLSGTGPESWSFRPGRGMHGHKAENAGLLSLVLPPAASRYSQGRFERLLEVYGSVESPPDVPDVARQIVAVVAASDQESAGSGRPPDIEEPKPAPKPMVAEIVLEEKKEDEPGAPAPKGDAVECARRMSHVCDPARLLDTLRRMVVACNFSKNHPHADVLLREDYVWFIIPRSLRKVAREGRLAFDARVGEELLRALGASPLVHPFSEGAILGRIEVMGGDRPLRAVRVCTKGFLTAIEQKRLNLFPHEPRVLPPRLTKAVAGWNSPAR